MTNFDRATLSAATRLKTAASRYDAIMRGAQSRLDEVAETRMQRRIEIMNRYIETIKKIQELTPPKL